jgi:hypothetical protein
MAILFKLRGLMPEKYAPTKRYTAEPTQSIRYEYLPENGVDDAIKVTLSRASFEQVLNAAAESKDKGITPEAYFEFGKTLKHEDMRKLADMKSSHKRLLDELVLIYEREPSSPLARACREVRDCLIKTGDIIPEKKKEQRPETPTGFEGRLMQYEKDADPRVTENMQSFVDGVLERRDAVSGKER